MKAGRDKNPNNKVPHTLSIWEEKGPGLPDPPLWDIFETKVKHGGSKMYGDRQAGEETESSTRVQTWGLGQFLGKSVWGGDRDYAQILKESEETAKKKIARAKLARGNSFLQTF